MKGPFLKFDDCPMMAEGRKTHIWRVASILGDVFLGLVEWYSPWHRYVFSVETSGTIFDSACLNEIANFISQRMMERKGVADEEAAT